MKEADLEKIPSIQTFETVLPGLVLNKKNNKKYYSGMRLKCLNAFLGII
jgi:hypothetical protein